MFLIGRWLNADKDNFFAFKAEVNNLFFGKNAIKNQAIVADFYVNPKNSKNASKNLILVIQPN
jgi:hypothetical protein